MVYRESVVIVKQIDQHFYLFQGHLCSIIVLKNVCPDVDVCENVKAIFGMSWRPIG